MDKRAYQREKLFDLMGDGSVWRLRDLEGVGVRSMTVSRLVAEGVLEWVSRGVYRLAAAAPHERQSLAEAAARAPGGVVCLLTAAELHGLTTHNPDTVWMAFPVGRHPPRIENPVLRPVFWRNPEAFDLGVEERTVAGVRVRVTDPARTVVDLYRFMNRATGAEAAMEALSRYADDGGDLGALRRYARRLGGWGTLEGHIGMKAFCGPVP